MIDKNGILVIDKYKGFTSFDVIAKLRGILKMKKIGHAGTLDPMATGVLPVFIGKSTKAIRYLENHDKEYIADFRLGIVTDTQDITGKELERNNVDISYAQVEEVVNSFVGMTSQLPPMFSAIKVGGRRLYEYARKGQEIKREPREIEFYSIEILGAVENTNTYTIKVKSSKGAYIRTLCHDIGQKLGVGATLSKLVRTEACGYKIKESYNIDRVEELVRDDKYDFLYPTESAFSGYKKILLDDINKEYFINGVKLPLKNISKTEVLTESKIYAVYNNDIFLGLAHPKEGRLRINRLFI